MKVCASTRVRCVRVLPFHADHLFERVHHIHQIALCRHHGINVFVSSGSLVNHVFVFAAFHTLGGRAVIGKRYAAFGFASALDAPRAV